MSAAGRPAVTPHYLDGKGGRLFAVHVAPQRPDRKLGGLIFVPPFAEEMNRSRRMAAWQARRLAAQGMEVLLLDLYGTGDSDGDFEAARWSLWLDDIATAAAWMEARSAAPLGLWGLRLGAMLAVNAAAAEPSRYSRLVLWQPVTEGKAMLTQFLRIRIAAAMGTAGGESMETLRAELAAGRSVEVAGYALAAEMARALAPLRLQDWTPARHMRVNWLELGAEAAADLGPAAERVVTAWRRAGIGVAAQRVGGDPFWTLQETTLAPELIQATARAVETCPV